MKHCLLIFILFLGTINIKAQTLYVTSGGSVVAQNTPVNIAGNAAVASGSTPLVGATVSISSNFVAGQDVLGLNGAASGGIASSYNATTGILTLSGSASAADYQTTLQKVTYTNTSATPATAARVITFSLNAALPFTGTGHYYEFISSTNISWTAANTAANTKTYFGLQGYLATITSLAENTFVYSKINASGWLGGSDAAAEGVWKWVCGPETGTQFWQGTWNGGSVVGGMYNNWDANQPDNWGTENYLHYYNGDHWNDFPNAASGIAGYMVEYGGMAGDPVLHIAGNVMVDFAPLVSNLAVTSGTDIKWYDAAIDGNLLASTTQLVQGNHYYASQTVNGCESATRLDVIANIDPKPQGSFSANGPFCVTGAGTLTWTATTGTGPYTVVYNDGTANRTVTNVTSGTPFAVYTTPVTSTKTYTLVSVQDAKCTRTGGFTGGTATITVNPIPTPTFTAQPGATAYFNTDVTYTTQNGKSNYTWTFPGTLNTDYTITSGGTTADYTVTLQYLTTGSKIVTINYTSDGCTAASATSSNATIVTCGGSITINHVTSDGVAPVNKTVSYGTVSTTLFGGTKCTITRNLGASQQATTEGDATEASAGWYWQFNQKQGFSYDGTTRTPNTTWIDPIDEPSDWLPANDPCALELGVAWRIPTYTEWVNALSNLPTSADAFASVLKIHSAGSLWYADGVLTSRGSAGLQWTGSRAFYQASNYLGFATGIPSYIGANNMSMGYSIRCLSDVLPTSATTAITEITATTASSGGNVTYDGGSAVTARGVCWGTSAKPTIALPTQTSNGSGTGTFTSSITGLTGNTKYYVRAYATNSSGTSYGNEYSFTTFLCGTSTLTITHVASGGVAPVDKTVIYGTVSTSLFGGTKCAITRNLGASQQATSEDDATEESAGWYWQFNLKQGYQVASDGTRTPNTTWINSIIEESDWIPANDPCAIELGAGWRIPTQTEWGSAVAAWPNSSSPYASVLKMHLAGQLTYLDGSLVGRGIYADYWPSTQYWNEAAWYLHNNSTDPWSLSGNNKSFGYSLRCIKDN